MNKETADHIAEDIAARPAKSYANERQLDRADADARETRAANELPAAVPAQTFTPGPWIVDDRHIHPKTGLTYPRGIEPETDVIVQVDTACHGCGLLNETDVANLQLIAAAPELVAALQDVTLYLAAAYSRFGITPKPEAVSDAIERAQALLFRIAKS